MIVNVLFQMDVECLLFTDLLLVCKASKRMDKYKIVKPPMRVDRIILHELKDKGKEIQDVCSTQNKGTLVFHGVQVNTGCGFHVQQHMHDTCRAL